MRYNFVVPDDIPIKLYPFAVNMPHSQFAITYLFKPYPFKSYLFKRCVVAVMLLLIGLPCLGQSLTSASFPETLTGLYDNNNQSFSPKLLRVRTLVKANVLGLAQRILESEGPADLPNKAWLNWERQLWQLYRIRENWQALYQRSRQIPPSFPQEIHKEADIQAIFAAIELHDGKTARALLRKHLLAKNLFELERREFRKLLIESYLADDLLMDAGVAMKNYQADFRSEKEDWLLLSAKVYLKHNYPDSAANLLSSIKLPSARLLRIFARLQNQSLQPAHAIRAAKKLLAELKSLPAGNAVKAYQVLAVIISARHSGYEFLPVVDELEQYLIATENSISELDNVYPHYTVADLLAAYKAAALYEGIQAALPTDSYVAWLHYVNQLPATASEQKKAIYGYLLQNQQDVSAKNAQYPFSRQQLNDAFVSSLIESGGIDIIPQLYGTDKPFGALLLSGNVNLEVSNVALSTGNIRLAAQVNRAFTDIPQGMERVDWLLRTVRIAIIAGDYDKGFNDLMLWLDEFDQLESAQTDRVLQPIFDLQTANQHELALKLLAKVNSRTQTDKHKREIAYWIAESYQATRQYIKAAEYFLFSALQQDNGFDRWGEAARYQAAEALLAANLVADSRLLFEDLLARTTTDNRKTQLKQKLQQLWLHESSLRSVEAVQ